MPRTTPTRADRILLIVFAAASALIGLGILAAGALRLRLYILAAGGGDTPVSLLSATPVDGARTGTDPEIVTGIHPTADLLVRGLSDGTRALLAVGEGLGTLVAVVVAGGVAALFISIARGRPFARGLSAMALGAGATLALGSLLAQGIAGFGRMTAADELNAAGSDFTVGFAFDPSPILIGFAVMALSYLFRVGASLQRDTEGLI